MLSKNSQDKSCKYFEKKRFRVDSTVKSHERKVVVNAQNDLKARKVLNS